MLPALQEFGPTQAAYWCTLCHHFQRTPQDFQQHMREKHQLAGMRLLDAALGEPPIVQASCASCLCCYCRRW